MNQPFGHSVPCDDLKIRFAGPRSGRWPLTVGQKNVLEWIRPDLPGPADILSAVVRATRGSTIDTVGAALGELIGRHEALRTVLRGGEQVVHAEGTLLAEVVEATGTEHDWHPSGGRAFDPAVDLPIRVRVVTRSGVPFLIVLHVSHVAADLSAMTVLRSELTALLAGRPLPPAVYHPADRATYEHSPTGQRQLDGSIKYWVRQTVDRPLCSLGLPHRFPDAEGHHQMLLGSRTAAQALADVAEKTGVRPLAVVMAAFASLLTRWTGSPGCMLNCLCSNRFSPELRDYVGTVSQETWIPFTASPSFLETVVQTNWAALAAYKYGRYDSAKLNAAMRGAERARGMPCHRDVVVNNTTGHSRAILPASGLEPGAGDRTFDAPVEFDVYRLDGKLGCGLGIDGRLATADETAAILGGVEQLIVAAAEGDVDPAAFGIAPVERGPGWVRARSCWVDLPAVQAVADQALGQGGARIEADGERLVARLAPGLDASAAAEAMVAAVIRQTRHGVVAPGDYV
ncbi:condensation domain-containing protein [Herbidospora mongoliensis]|uniref:condensation domain-containing protein n=1 Tax=Herbidospora mongoliensis TaxID=688067 RepID=UPI00083212EC|nr:condensation domain-containing protein [Herbidospora mongoliensis]